jgi:hypothetical protein
MIPLYRSAKSEPTVNLLAKHLRQVVVDAAYWCKPAIRLRPDVLNADHIYFDRTKSQVIAWQSTGGVLIRWDRKTVCGPFDAVFYAECPRAIELLDRYSQDARWINVVYQPPTWKQHLDTLAKRTADKPDRKKREMADALERMKQLLESSEPFTSDALARLLLSHQGQIVPPSSAPVLREAAARAAGTTSVAP